MINITATATTVPFASQYPYLGLYKDGSFIVLFIRSRSGSVVFSSRAETAYNLGQVETGWNEHDFSRYTGEIRLSNVPA